VSTPQIRPTTAHEATHPGNGHDRSLSLRKRRFEVKGRFGEDLKIMASGGVRTHADAVAMVEAGAERIATSNPLAVLGLA
jgi:deoxyribose-phosphate aldolase